MKKNIATILILTMVLIPNSFAFSFLGIDFGNFFDKIMFWKNDDSNNNNIDDSNQNNINVQQKTSTNNKKTNSVKSEVSINIAQHKYTQSNLKSIFNNNEEIKGYVKGFGYECVYINTDKTEQFTLFFDTEKGTLTSLKKGNHCSQREIYLEESLIEDLSANGFSAKKIKSYLEKVDLPWSMYGKALKVFTIG